MVRELLSYNGPNGYSEHNQATGVILKLPYSSLAVLERPYPSPAVLKRLSSFLTVL